MSKRDDDFELDEFDKYDDADDDELFERESQEEDFEERMNRETEAYLKGVDDGASDSIAGIPMYPADDDLEDEEFDDYEQGYYDGYRAEDDSDDEMDDLDE